LNNVTGFECFNEEFSIYSCKTFCYFLKKSILAKPFLGGIHLQIRYIIQQKILEADSMSEIVQYRIYKVSVHVFFYSYVGNSKIYTIPPGKSTIFPGLKYSLLTFLFGWWVFSVFDWYKKIRMSMIALHVNFDGGEDYTKLISEAGYDSKTTWIYNNLSREIASKLSIENLDVIVELQEHCNDKNLPENITFLNHNLEKIALNHLFNTDLEQIIATYNRYEVRILDEV